MEKFIATGAEPIAITDNLNFGNPEKKEIMYEIKEAIKGIKKPVMNSIIQLFLGMFLYTMKLTENLFFQLL